jgi:hypothetical protein
VHEGHSDLTKRTYDCRCVDLLECDLGKVHANVNNGREFDEEVRRTPQRVCNESCDKGRSLDHRSSCITRSVCDEKVSCMYLLSDVLL